MPATVPYPRLPPSAARASVLGALLAAVAAVLFCAAPQADAAPAAAPAAQRAPAAQLPAAPEPAPTPTPVTPTPTPTATATPAPGPTSTTPGTVPTDPNTNTPVTPALFNPFNPGDWIGAIGGWLTGSGGVGLPDISGLVIGAITGLLGKIVEEAAQPLLDLLGKTLLATPDPAANPSIREVWTTSLGITAGVYGLFIVAGGATIMAYESVQTRYAAKQIGPRLVVSFLTAAMSLELMHYAVELSNAVAQTILGQGVDGAGIVARLFNPTSGGLFFLILVVVQFAVLIAVLLGFMVRAALVMLLAACAPLAIACHASPATDGLARLWWRAFGGCLAIQVAQATTLIVGIRALYGQNGASPFGFPTAGGIGAVLAGLALFYILLKIPSWATSIIFQAVPRRSGGGIVRTVLRGLMYWRLGTAAVKWWKQRQPRGGGGRPGGRGPGGGRGRGGGGGRGPRRGGGGGGRGPRRGAGPGAGGGPRGPNAARGRAAGGAGPRAARPAAVGPLPFPPPADSSAGTPAHRPAGAAGAGSATPPPGSSRTQQSPPSPVPAPGESTTSSSGTDRTPPAGTRKAASTKRLAAGPGSAARTRAASPGTGAAPRDGAARAAKPRPRTTATPRPGTAAARAPTDAAAPPAPQTASRRRTAELPGPSPARGIAAGGPDSRAPAHGPGPVRIPFPAPAVPRAASEDGARPTAAPRAAPRAAGTPVPSRPRPAPGSVPWPEIERPPPRRPPRATGRPIRLHLPLDPPDTPPPTPEGR